MIVTMLLISSSKSKIPWNVISDVCGERTPGVRNDFGMFYGGKVTENFPGLKANNQGLVILPWDIEEAFDDGVKLGAGSFGVVKEGTLFVFGDQKQIAIKRVIQSELDINEMYIMYRLGIRGAGPIFYGCQFDHEHVYIAQQLLARDLESEHFISAIKTKPITKVLDLYRQMFVQLKIMWEEGFVHNDIKPANMMTDENNETIYLIDFGMGQEVGTKQEPCGSPAFMSPKKFLLEGNVSIWDDIYSMALSIGVLEAKDGLNGVFKDYISSPALGFPKKCFSNFKTGKCGKTLKLDPSKHQMPGLRNILDNDDCFGTLSKEVCRKCKSSNMRSILEGHVYGTMQEPKMLNKRDINFPTLMFYIVSERAWANISEFRTHDDIITAIDNIIARMSSQFKNADLLSSGSINKATMDSYVSKNKSFNSQVSKIQNSVSSFQKSGSQVQSGLQTYQVQEKSEISSGKVEQDIVAAFSVISKSNSHNSQSKTTGVFSIEVPQMSLYTQSHPEFHDETLVSLKMSDKDYVSGHKSVFEKVSTSQNAYGSNSQNSKSFSKSYSPSYKNSFGVMSNEFKSYQSRRIVV